MSSSGEQALPVVEGFEVLRRLGRGGMGEVLEAERVGPEGFRKRVALKQLALDLSIDRTAVSRFFQEARICARLEHPNIVRVQDLLNDGGRPFIVMELLRGVTLWELVRSLRMSGSVEWWVPLAIAEQALSALEYAHALSGDDGAPLGLVHRDLTPRNVMVTEGGVVKVLDFGIAKLTSSLSAPALTADGSVAGTLEFFSPEQAQAMPLDARSDLFQLAGAVFWALTGSPPNGSGTPAEVLTRAVVGPPISVRTLRADVPEDVAAFLERALSRDRDARFPDAKSMHAEARKLLAGKGAVELAALVKPLLPAVVAAPSAASISARTQPASPLARQRSGSGDAVEVSRTDVSPPRAASDATSRRTVVAGFAATVVVGAGAFWAGRSSNSYTPRPPRRPPEFNRLTWRRGTIHAARFTSDDSYVCCGAFDNEPMRTWLGVPGNPEGRSLEFGTAELLAVSKQQELSLLNDVELIYGFVRRGTLAQVMLSGGAPRDVLSDVQWVDYQPETSALAVVRWKGDHTTLEFPLDKVRHETQTGWIGETRFSPNGKHLAFVFHPARYDDAGSVWMVDVTRDAPAKALTGPFASIRGLAWRDARTVWFTASKEGLTRELHAVDLEGTQRLIERAPVTLRLFDLGSRGRALVTREATELAAAGKLAGDAVERELSIFDTSYAGHISADGSRVLIGEGAGDAVGSEGAVYLRKGASAPVRLGTGLARELSPDGAWALVNPFDRKSLVMLPTGAGTQKRLELPAKTLVNTAVFFPDGKRVLASVGDETAKDTKFASIDVASGAATVLPISGFLGPLVLPLSPDGARVVLMKAETELLEWVDVASGESTPVLGVKKGESALRVSGDGKFVFVAQFETRPLSVVRLDVKSGERSEFLSLAPKEAAGVDNVPWAVLSADASSYAYTFHRVLSTLYLMTDAD
ncbi:MAG: protein kinase [Archangium sp.]